MSGEETSLAEVDVKPHIIDTEIPRDVRGEPLTEQEQRVFDVCDSLKDNPAFWGAYRFGTHGGDDIDIRLYYTTLPSEPEQDTIRERFQNLGHDPVDIHFITEEEFSKGILHDIAVQSMVEAHLREGGFNPHDQRVGLKDNSVFAAYVYATMRKFYEAPDRALPNPQEAEDKVEFTREGAVAWSHFYTGAFLNEYKHFYENDALDTKAYQARLAKFVSRVTLGSVLAQLDPEQLVQFKRPLMDAIKKANQHISTDELMVTALLYDVNASGFINDETQALLRRAGRIRSNPEEFDQAFVTDAEEALLYYGYQQGIEKRSGETDFLTSFALEKLMPQIAEREEYNKGHELIKQDAPGQLKLYYLPIEGNTEGVMTRVEKNGQVVARPEEPGNLLGETALFTDHAAETVIIQEDGTKVWAIDVQTLAAMFTDDDIEKELQQKVLSTKDARIADILLQYFSRHAFRMVRESFPYTNLLKGLETHELLTEDNPLINYYLGDKFHDILQTFVGKPDSFVTEISAKPDQELTLFEQGDINDKFFVVSDGEVSVYLDSGEDIRVAKGITVGESAFFDLKTKGSASLSKGGRALAIDVKKFLEYTQSHKEIDLPEQYQGQSILPRHLLYHLAAVGYGRLRRRLSKQDVALAA